MSLIKRNRQSVAAVNSSHSAVRPLMEPVEARQLLSGGVAVKLVAIPISNAALMADPSLANFKSFDLQVTVTGNDHWSAGELIIKLKTGSFYLPSGAQNTPQQSLWSFQPNMEFHNFVSGPGFADPSLLVSPVPDQQPTISSKLFSIDWGVIGSANTGTFTIARLTIQNGSTGTLNGKTGDTNSPGVLPKFSSVVPFSGNGA